MFPIICELGPFTIYSYGLTVVLGFSICVFLITRQAKSEGLNQELIFNICFSILLSGIIGARLLYIILNFAYFFRHPAEMVMINRGGLAWFGGLFLSGLTCVIYLKYKRLDVYKIADLIIPYVALAQAIGRIGCFLNGCCFGRESLNFGLYFPVHDAVLIPTQVYSCLLLLVIYIILRIRQSQKHQKGEILYSYFFLYSLKRFFIEFLRADSEIFILSMSIFQVFSIGLFLFSLVMLIRIKKGNNRPR